MAINKIYVIYDTSILAAADCLGNFIYPLHPYWWIHCYHVLPTFIQSEIQGLIGSEKDEIGRKARASVVKLLATGLIREPGKEGLNIDRYPSHLLGADSKNDKYLIELARSYSSGNTASLIATLDNGIKVDAIRLQQSGENVFCDSTIGNLINLFAPAPEKCPRCHNSLINLQQLYNYFLASEVRYKRSWLVRSTPIYCFKGWVIPDQTINRTLFNFNANDWAKINKINPVAHANLGLYCRGVKYTGATYSVEANVDSLSCYSYTLRLLDEPQSSRTYSTKPNATLRHADFDQAMFAAKIICLTCNDIVLQDLINNLWC